ncbi:MAG: ABC transporter permease [Bryobacterales bacterium]|nr:ABC transporter permease [Bryobacterales bacterium]MBV9397196.1 ABC transporter permease [Bryobacterales bacterium]
MFELFVARRYLNANRKQVVISVITLISVIGVAAGVMALIIAVAIQNGFRNTLEHDLLSATAPVSILEKEPSGGIDNWEEIAAKVAKLPHVKSASPGLYEPGLLSLVNSDFVEVKGVPFARGAPVPELLGHLKSGSIRELGAGANELPGVILGARLADEIGAVQGKQVRLIIPNGKLRPFGVEPSVENLRVAGIFESGFYDVDLHWAYMRLENAQTVFRVGDVVNVIELQIDNIFNARTIADSVDPVVGPKLAATTWLEQYRAYFDALKMERIVTVITIGLIQMVGALNILIALIMMVMEKHRDIALLMSMGARIQQIRRIFVFQGAMIGAAGTIIGLTIGYVVCHFADKYHWLRLNEQVYALSYVPFNARWLDGLWIAAAAMAVSLIATLYPARNATRIAPAEALRYE